MARNPRPLKVGDKEVEIGYFKGSSCVGQNGTVEINGAKITSSFAAGTTRQQSRRLLKNAIEAAALGRRSFVGKNSAALVTEVDGKPVDV